jgi:hypothetical protein
MIPQMFFIYNPMSGGAIAGLELIMLPYATESNLFTGATDSTMALVATDSRFTLNAGNDIAPRQRFVQAGSNYVILPDYSTVSRIRTIVTPDFVTFTVNDSTSAVPISRTKRAIWYDEVNARLVLCGIHTASPLGLATYVSSDLGVTWTYHNNVFSGSVGAMFGAEVGSNLVAISYQVNSLNQGIVFVNKNNINIVSSISGVTSDYLFKNGRYFHGVGVGGASYGQWVFQATNSIKFVDETSTGVTAHTTATTPSNWNAIDMAYKDGRYVVAFEDTTGNHALKMYYTSALSASPSWTACAQPAISGTTGGSNFTPYSTLLSTLHGFSLLYSDSGTSTNFGIMHSSTGSTFTASAIPPELTAFNCAGFVL